MQTSGNMRSLLFVAVVGFIGLLALPAQSQQTDLRIRATVAKIDNNLLVFQGKANGISSVSLDSDTAVFINRPSSLSAIKRGDYIASAAVKGADGKLRSKELRIFPEALRGIGEGQRPMNAPDTLMTNASVSEVMAAPEGEVVKVKYKDGTAELVVGPQVPITAVVASDASALKPGTRVFIFAAKAPDGTVRAKRILAGN
jgi:hypothetical protein